MSLQALIDSIQSTWVTQFVHQFTKLDFSVAHVVLISIIIQNIALRATRSDCFYNTVTPPVIVVVGHH
jgi:hypothetical protein